MSHLQKKNLSVLTGLQFYVVFFAKVLQLFNMIKKHAGLALMNVLLLIRLLTLKDTTLTGLIAAGACRAFSSFCGKRTLVFLTV